jgi:hypothetical protein
MKYSVVNLDKRFSFNQWFQYYLDFPNSMSDSEGVLNYNRSLQWFIQTYGWSAEVRQYADMHKWATRFIPLMRAKGRVYPTTSTHNLPKECNPQWSWSNGYNNLRIYLATDKELAFFQLSFPVDR